MTCRFWRNSLPKQMKFVRSDPTDFEWGNFTTALVCVCLIWGKVKTTETDTLAGKWTDCVLFPSMDHTEIILFCVWYVATLLIYFGMSRLIPITTKSQSLLDTETFKSQIVFLSVYFIWFSSLPLLSQYKAISYKVKIIYINLRR